MRLLCVPLAAAKLCRHEWVLEDVVVNYLDPMATMDRGEPVPFELRSAGQYVNRKYPGPLLECDEGDDVEVLLINRLRSDATTIHWHGLHMNDGSMSKPTPWADGTFRFAQAGIRPGENYTYRFVAYPPGTHWWHAHMDALQVDRGVKGPIVIHAANEKATWAARGHPYDEDLPIFLADTRRVPEVCLKLEGQAVDVGNPVCNEIDKMSWNGAYGNGSKLLPYPLIEVEKGKCYRLRFIGAGGNTQNWQVDISGHNTTLIALDGNDIEPIAIEKFNLHTGERYDMILCADQEPGNYLLNATYDLACQLVGNGTGFKPGEIVPFIPLPSVDACLFYAFLHYKGHEEVPRNVAPPGAFGGGQPVPTGGGLRPREKSGVWFDLNTNDRGYMLARNLDRAAEPAAADMDLTLFAGILSDNFEYRHVAGPGQFGLPVQVGWAPDPTTLPLTKGGRTYLSERKKPRELWSMSPHWPSTPLLHTKGQCGTNSANVLDIPEHVETLEITIVNLSPSAHVFHLHGMYFQVINYGYPEWCDLAHQNQCFFMPYAVAQEVAKKTINGTAVISDPEHPLLGGTGQYWGVLPDKSHPNYKKSLNLEASLRKDTVSLWRHQWVTLRIRPRNPGVWLLHCHMEQHVPTGMIAALNVRPSQQPPIPAEEPRQGKCPRWSDAEGRPQQHAGSRVAARLEVYDWVVDYARPTATGAGWGGVRVTPVELAESKRSAMALFNGSWPGPVLRFKAGDRVGLTLANRALAEPVSIHFHGLSMQASPQADGVVGVTQKSILPGEDSDIAFTAEPAGTHLYAAGSDGLLPSRGLKGVVVVEDPQDPYGALYDSELLLQVSDAWQEPETCFLPAGANRSLCPPVDLITFNGAYGNGTTKYAYPYLTVEKGKCYRLRLAGLLSEVRGVNVSLDAHDFSVLAADGVDVAKTSVGSVYLHAGERFDMLLCADQPHGAYALVADACAEAPGVAECRFYMVVRYKSLLRTAALPAVYPPPRQQRASGLPALDLRGSDGYAVLSPLSPVGAADRALRTVRFFFGQTETAHFLAPTAEPFKPGVGSLIDGSSATRPVVQVDGPIEVEVVNLTPKDAPIHFHGPRVTVVAVGAQPWCYRRCPGALRTRCAALLAAPAGARADAWGCADNTARVQLQKDTVVVPARGTVRVSVPFAAGAWLVEAMRASDRIAGAAAVLEVRQGW